MAYDKSLHLINKSDYKLTPTILRSMNKYFTLKEILVYEIFKIPMLILTYLYSLPKYVQFFSD